MRTINSLVFALAAVAGSAMVAPAEAQYDRRPAYDDASEREAHGHGYQSGLAAGRDDARGGRAADHDRHDVYRRANVGFRVDGGGVSLQFYQTTFRRGFDEGYRTGYAEFHVGAGRGTVDGGIGYASGQPYRERDYRGDRPGYGRRGYAFDRGFNEGYREGLDDGRDGDRYNVTGKRDYRRGDDGYNRRYGSRERYKDEYRDGFRAGYDQAYRQSDRRGYSNRDQRGRW